MNTQVPTLCSQLRLQHLGYVILLCDELEPMKSFYRDLLAFPIVQESETGATFCTGSLFLGLRKRTRHYDGCCNPPSSPGVQLAFKVSPVEVDTYHQRLLQLGVNVLDPPIDQPWGHRTVYFADPEGNLLEIYGEQIRKD